MNTPPNLITSLTRRPADPYRFRGVLTAGEAKHHIMPWRELEKIGIEILKDKKNKAANVNRIFDAINDSAKASIHLGRSSSINFVANLLADNPRADDVEVWLGLIAWLPGNIVVGPLQHSNDPLIKRSPRQRGNNWGDKFDEEAFELLQKADIKYRPRCKAILDLKNRSLPLDWKAKLLAQLGKGSYAKVGSDWRRLGLKHSMPQKRR